MRRWRQRYEEFGYDWLYDRHNLQSIHMNHSEIVSFLWSVADLIRDTFKRGTRT